MEVLDYKELCLKYNNVEDQNAYELKVRSNAEGICERRGTYAASIEKQITERQNEIDSINGYIKKIENTCDVSVEGSKLRDICSKLKIKMTEYITKASHLKERFENKKIKVIVFGPKSEGKSTFTGLYTGLSVKIIAIKGNKADEDKTGATSRILQNDDYTVNSPKIDIKLKSKNQILAEINKILLEFKDNNLILELPKTSDGVYKNWNDFYNVVKRDNNMHNGEKESAQVKINGAISMMNDFYSKRQYLVHVFESESDFEEINEVTGDDNQITKENVSINNLPQYNDMTNHEVKRYMTVEQITISLDLGHNNMFQNFEIYDTKGISDNGGGPDAENLIFKEINKCDAVFSIKSVGGRTKAVEFYGGLSNTRNRIEGPIPENLELKHFAILNLFQGIGDETVKQTEEAITNANLANCIYVGSLGKIEHIEQNDGTREDDQRYVYADGEKIEAQKFANYVIVDMLGRIAESTKKYDDTLINECCKLADEIQDLKQQLCDKILNLQVPARFNCDDAIVQAIETFQMEALRKIDSKADELKIQHVKPANKNTESDYVRIDNPQETSTDFTQKTALSEEEINKDIYYMITGKEPDEDSNATALRNNDPVSVALGEIFDDVKDKAGKRVRIGTPGSTVSGNVQTLGSYIDDLCALVYDRVAPNINEKYAPSHPIQEIKDTCNDFLRILWEAFRFDKLFNKEFKDGEIYKEYSNIRFQSWYKLYSELNVDTSVDRLSPILAFDILQSYFVKVERPKKMELLSPIVNSKTLKDAMIETYKQFHFKELITQKVDDADRKKGNIVTTLVSNLNTGKITDDLFPLYDPKVVGEEKLKEIKILDGPTLEKIGRDEKWKNLKAQGVALGAVTVNKLKIPEINNVHN